MARGRKTGGRQKGTRNRATEEARAAAAATGILPLDHMLSVMRDLTADPRRRDAMAMAAAPYLHSRLSPTEPPTTVPTPGNSKLVVEFVSPTKSRSDDDL
jgi:hypothetical protein